MIQKPVYAMAQIREEGRNFDETRMAYPVYAARYDGSL